MKELKQQLNNKHLNNPPEIPFQEEIDQIFKKINEKTEIIIIQNIEPTSAYKSGNLIGININFYKCNFNRIINLELLPKKMPYLKSIVFHNISLKTLKGLPSDLPSLEGIAINHCPLKNLKHFPTSLPNLKRLKITFTNLTNLEKFPQINPNLLERLEFQYNQITSLKGLPPYLPNLKDFNVNHNYLTSLKYLPKFKNGKILYIRIQNNPLRTLFNMNEDLIKKFVDSKYQKLFTLSPRGRQLIAEYRVPFIDENGLEAFYIYPKVLKKITAFYNKPISEIAEKYIRYQKHQEPITEDELDRLVWEADLEDRKFLETNLPTTTNDPVLYKINQRFTIPLPSNFNLFK